jgi:hypothetical protein
MTAGPISVVRHETCERAGLRVVTADLGFRLYCVDDADNPHELARLLCGEWFLDGQPVGVPGELVVRGDDLPRVRLR